MFLLVCAGNLLPHTINCQSVGLPSQKSCDASMCKTVIEVGEQGEEL